MIVLQTQTVTPLLTYLNNRGGDIRRKDEESSRHRQFRQGNASVIKKTPKVDKSVRSHPSVRRPHELKRISSDRICEVSNKENPQHNSTEDLTRVDPKMQKNKNPEKLITLDANEFPAMQSSCEFYYYFLKKFLFRNSSGHNIKVVAMFISKQSFQMILSPCDGF